MDEYTRNIVDALSEYGKKKRGEPGEVVLHVLCQVPVSDDGILAPALAQNEDQALSQIEEMMKQKLVRCDDGTFVRDDGRKFVWMYNLKKWLSQRGEDET